MLRLFFGEAEAFEVCTWNRRTVWQVCSFQVAWRDALDLAGIDFGGVVLTWC